MMSFFKVTHLVVLALCSNFNNDILGASVSASFVPNAKSYLRCATAVKENNHAISSSTSPCNDDIIYWPSSSSTSSQIETETHTQTRKQAEAEIITYLYKNLMTFDHINALSLGFPVKITSGSNSTDDGELPDGLSNGILEPTINISMHAKQNYPWTKTVPKELYYEYVINFANVNEARTNWRPIFHKLAQPIIQPLLQQHSSNSTVTAKQVIQRLNDKVWKSAASYSNTESITFQHGQTPLIYDPMSVLLFGYASCTGLSIFFVNLLRTVGIPARLAGTAAWNNVEENGNHSWIEVWDNDDRKWHIMETKPASGNHENVDLYDPCQWWFCNDDKMKDTLFWAARLDGEESGGVIFPMAWDTENKAVVGEERTTFMRELCSGC